MTEEELRVTELGLVEFGEQLHISNLGGWGTWLRSGVDFIDDLLWIQDAQLILDVLELDVMETREIRSDIIHGLQAHDKGKIFRPLFRPAEFSQVLGPLSQACGEGICRGGFEGLQQELFSHGLVPEVRQLVAECVVEVAESLLSSQGVQHDSVHTLLVVAEDLDADARRLSLLLRGAGGADAHQDILLFLSKDSSVTHLLNRCLVPNQGNLCHRTHRVNQLLMLRRRIFRQWVVQVPTEGASEVLQYSKPGEQPAQESVTFEHGHELQRC
mmetsp:Transcript_77087/g.170196  ORF Transcript_77087/g.170196 Transcript_77087/m.170196 type:complete len:271 (-) Transcript_77087:317-1129(-)